MTSFWLPDPADKNGKIRVRDDAHQAQRVVDGEPQFHWIPAIVDELRSKGLFELFAKEVVFGPGKKPFILKQTELRKEFLVWLEDAGVNFDQAAEARWGSANITKLGPSIGLMEGMHPVLRKRQQLPEGDPAVTQQDVERLHSQVGKIEEIVRGGEGHGHIVYRNFPKEWDRLIVCLKHMHGHMQGAAILVNAASKVQREFLLHQEHGAAIGRAVLALSPPEKRRLYLETFPETPEHWDQFPAEVKGMIDISKHTSLFQGLLLNKEDFEPMNRFFKTMNDLFEAYLKALSENRFADAKKSFQEGNILARLLHPGRILGAELLEAGNTGIYGDGRVETGITAYEPHDENYLFMKPHITLARGVHEHLPTGGIGVLMDGGGHFRSNNKEWKRAQAGAYLEDYLDHVPGTACMVIEPYHYDSLDIEFRRQMERKKDDR
ncbi:MAG: hypothetical protein Greene101449_201 [Candidatus Peregrinibacteria bacterium Greene1014_49]|nr:MAG: hypothetical protein Greene101449_201 [Candidatus Peregrinibacteria bacterium Greene1014_49]